MNVRHDLVGTAFVLVLAFGAAGPGAAQDPEPGEAPRTEAAATREDVRKEADEAIDALRSYSEARRMEAQARAREALDRMRDRMARTQDEWADERSRVDEALRESRARSMADARQLLERAQERARALEAANQAEWQRAREGFVDSYGRLAAGVEALVARSMPGRPLPPRDEPADAPEPAAEDAPADAGEPEEPEEDATP